MAPAVPALLIKLSQKSKSIFGGLEMSPMKG
jgi:hypothetical protein